LLYTCLFGSRGHDLRAPLRAGATDDELRGIVRAVWAERADRYSELRSQATARGRALPLVDASRVEMSRIGG
jgi:GTP 3',8-cyclase